MNNRQLQNNTCKIVNTVWIDRGIILTILYYLTKKYDKLKDKIIIINNPKYRKLFRLLFPKLIFEKYKKHNNQNFYINIRTIIRKQDVIIDYINNYIEFVNTDKIKLVPWFDMNDILITYIYNNNKKKYIAKYINHITEFNKCKRANYNNKIYDKFIEDKIFNLYIDNKKNSINLIDLIKIINGYTGINYTDTVNNYMIPIQTTPITIQKIIKNKCTLSPNPISPQITPPQIIPPQITPPQTTSPPSHQQIIATPQQTTPDPISTLQIPCTNDDDIKVIIAIFSIISNYN